MSYPPDFQSWPQERRNAWFAAEARAYRETKAPGNGAADHAKLQGGFDGFDSSLGKGFPQNNEEAERLLAARAPDNDEIPSPRLIVNDATVEKLGELLNENPHGLLLVRDELPGFLARMESEEYQSERAFYLEAFNGDGKYTYDRIGRGTIPIENWTLSIIGGIQPARIAPLVRGGNRHQR